VLRASSSSTAEKPPRGGVASLRRISAFLVRGSGLQAGLLFFAVAFLYFWPALTAQGVLSQAAALYDWFPWKAFRPPDLHAYDSSVADPAREFYPWLDHARDSIRSGDLPEWNPYALGGTPFLGNQGTALFSPFNVFFWILPFKYAFGFVAALKLWVAAFGTYLLVRELRLGFWPAVVAGLAFGFCPFSIVWLLHTHVNVVVFLPWVLWGAERIVRRGGTLDGLALAVPLAFALLGGHPGSQLHLLAALMLYVVIRLLLAPELGRRARLVRAAVVAGAVTVGALVAAVSLLPAAYLVPEAAGPFQSVHSGGGGTLPRSTLLTLFFPDWWGRPSGIQLTRGPDGVGFNERTFYTGAIPLALAAVALSVRADWRAKLPFALLAFLGLVVPLGVEPFHWLFAHLPLFDSVLNARLLVLVDLGVAVLAAYGVAYLLGERAVRRAPEDVGRRAYAAGAGAVVIGLLTALALTPSPHALAQTARHFLTGAEYAVARVLELTAIGWWTLFALGFLAALLLARRFGPRVLAPLLAALVVADLGHFLYGYQPIAPAERVYGFTPPSLAFLQREAGADRVAALGSTLPANTGMPYGLRDIRGYDPPLPNERYLRFFLVEKGRRLVYPGLTVSGRVLITEVSPNRRRLLDLMSVRYLLTAPHESPSASGLTRVYAGKDATVFRNDQSAPRAYVPTRVTVADDDETAFSVLTGSRFVPGEDATLEAPSDVSAGSGTVRIVEEEDARVELRTDLSRGGLVVLNDTWADGWSAAVDGRSAEELVVNTLARGVDVPAGVHRVVWSYRTPGFVIGLALTLAGVVLVLAWLAWGLLGPRRLDAASAADERRRGRGSP
jgi:hypothetical protein